MNCQDIARILDEQEVDSLLAEERSGVHAHLATCRDCARDWQIHAQLLGVTIPAVPAELRALYVTQAAGVVAPGARRRGRFVVIGTLVTVAACSGNAGRADKKNSGARYGNLRSCADETLRDTGFADAGFK